MTASLRPLLRPESIAILGASTNLEKLNGRPLKFLLKKGYKGPIYPVNPKYSEISGLTCYPTVEAIPGAVDLAVVAVPAKHVAGAISELGKKRVPAAVVISSGFAEIGEEGRALERELVEVARTCGVRLLGPNTLGLINTFENVMASFSQYADGETLAGPVGFVSQSGAFGTAIAALARNRDLGLGYFVATGNEADVNFVSAMREVLADPRIEVGAGYIEGVLDGAGLLALGKSTLEQGKPLVVTKVGRSKAGSRAAASHTGSLAGEDAVFEGVTRQAGIIRARNEEHLLDLVEAFKYCGLPDGRGLGLITQSGGAGVLMADRAEELGLGVPVLNEATQQALKKVIPEFGSAGNPVDITGQFLADPASLLQSMIIMLADPQIHVGVIWFQLMEAHVDVLVGVIEEIKARATKPFVVCWVAAPDRAIKALRKRGIAVLRGAEPAIDAVAGLIRYAESRRSWLADTRARANIRLPAFDLPAAGGPVPTLAAARLLEAGGMSVARTVFATSSEEAISGAETLHYPVALKIESADILHKTEAGGVRTGLKDENAVREAFAAIMTKATAYRPEAKLGGVVVSEMVTGDLELVIGLQNDPVFGVVIMVGFGGILVEVLEDVAFAKAPVTALEADRMLEDLRGSAILGGVRGRPAINRDALIEMICAVSRFGAAAGDRLKEVDLNPVLVGAERAVAVDWLVVLNE